MPGPNGQFSGILVHKNQPLEIDDHKKSKFIQYLVFDLTPAECQWLYILQNSDFATYPHSQMNIIKCPFLYPMFDIFKRTQRF